MKGKPMRLLIVSFVAVFFMICVLLVSPVYARTWRILPDGTGDAPTIQAGIDSAVVGDIVELTDGHFYEHDIYMKSSITLRGQQGTPGFAQIHGQGFAGIWSVETFSSTIDGLSIVNCGEAGIRVDSSSLSIQNCYFANNTFTDGGAIHMIDSEVTISDCNFFDNYSSHNGGAIAMGRCMSNITSCHFENNLANFGGVVDVESFSSLTMESCTLINNTAVFVGGGLYVWVNQGSSTLSISDSTIGNNQAPLGSDGWVSEYCTLILNDCNLELDFQDTFGGAGTLIIDGPVSSVESTWGSVKALYR